MLRSKFFKISAILWIIWGVFHFFLGAGLIYLLSIGNEALSIDFIANDPIWAGMLRDYAPIITASLLHYSWNILWFGVVISIAAVYIWKKNVNAIFLCAIIGGLADLGYLVFVDLQGFAPPIGTIMTFVSAGAILFSFYAYFKMDVQEQL